MYRRWPAPSGVLHRRMLTAPIEDMAPFLPRVEFLENMIVAPVREDPDGAGRR